MENGQNFCFRSVVKEDPCEEMTFGQRSDQSEEVSHGDICRRSILGAGGQQVQTPRARNCPEASVGDSEQGTKRQGLTRQFQGVWAAPEESEQG